ncbi:MAG: TolC family protein, partial [Sulfurimonas sp.]|nr:TolC family protein [Sulfurimonas sp.]
QKNIFLVEDKILELQESVQKAKNEFRYLANQDFTDVQKVQIKEEFSKEEIKKSPKYKILELKSKQLEIIAKLQQRNKYSNITLSASYNHRDKFDDYLSVSTSFALPIYGREDAEVKKTHYLKQESAQNTQNYLQNTIMLFDNNYERVEYLSKRVQNLDAIIERYKELRKYDNANIRNSITLEKNIENENLLLDLEVEKLKYKLEIRTALLELFYLTKESL